MDKWIGKPAIKMSLLQVVPGEEIRIAKILEKRCRNDETIHQYAILKAFGAFDIVLIYAVSDFGIHFTKTGSLTGIIKSNAFHCFPYIIPEKPDDIFSTIENNALVGLCFIKIKPELFPKYQSYLSKRFLKRLKRDKPNWHVLGSLGWNELIMIITSDDIDSLCEDLRMVGDLLYEADTGYYTLKTFSHLALNYSCLTMTRNSKSLRVKKHSQLLPSKSFDSLRTYPFASLSCEPMHMKAINHFLIKNNFSVKTTLGKYDISAIPHKKDNWHSFLNKLLELRCWPDTEVLCTAIGTQILDNFPLLKVSDFKDLSSLAVKLRDPQDPLSLYIRGHFFEATQQLLAEYNGSSLPSEQLNAALVDGLNRVLCDASLYSEERFKGITLVETTSGLINKKPKGDTLVYLNRLLLEQAYPHAVRNSLKMHDSGDNKAAVNIHAESASKIISLSKDTVTKIVEQLGEEVGYELVSHVYAFNSLIQNNITGKAYEDVSRYPHYLLDSLLPHKTGLDEMIGALEAFRYGCQLRAYGTYDYFEGGAGRFSRFKGGIQRVLLAMEYIPNTILKESIDWKGFVVSGWTEKFQTLNQVINVPSASVWSVRDWWAIYHETGHVLNNSIQGLVSSKVPAIDFWLNKNVPKSAREHWLSNLGELSAEVLGFELGFYGKFDLFMEKMWRYIGELEDIYGNLMQLYYYSFRTFFVWLFYSHFREGTISQEDFQDVDFCFKEYLSHIETIEKIIGRDFPDKPFKPREHAKLICSLYDFGDHLNRFINEFELTAMTSELDEPNTLAVFNSLQKGIVWPEPIKYPRAVLYKILEMENDEISFESKIACILSFWNGNITNYQ